MRNPDRSSSQCRIASDGVLFSANSAVTLAAGQSADVAISLSTVKGAPNGNKQATLRVLEFGEEIAHAVVFVLIGSGTGAPGQHELPPSQLK